MNSEPPICEANLGWAYGCSRTGFNHIQNKMPCQDAYRIATGSVAGSPYIVVAVADGHGDTAHDLSQFGAALAVKAAIDELQSVYSHFAHSLVLLSRNFTDDFPRLVSRRWRSTVLEDAKDRLSDNAASPDSKQLWTRYGTTLLVALIVSEVVLVGQIGDGDIVFIRADGTVESPMKKDSSLVGMATNSLCSTDATHLWQTAILRPEDGGMLLLATDGLSDAFGSDEEHLHTFARKLAERIKEYGIAQVAAAVPTWLDEKYSQASGDDITLTLVNVKEGKTDPATHVHVMETESPHPSKEAKSDVSMTFLQRIKRRFVWSHSFPPKRRFPMSLDVGDTVRAEGFKLDLTVKKKLGEGGQGVVYLVEGAKGSFAVKWYSQEQATPEQRESICKLTGTHPHSEENHSPPPGAAGRRFIWPLDLVVSPHSSQFGYLMPLIETKRFAELWEVQAGLKGVPGYPVLCEISYQAANSYRALHLAGLCYRDVSEGNLMFDPDTGDVLICDNDNIGVDGHSECQVLGTLEFMAPELIRGDKSPHGVSVKPSTKTDLHSLAVLLFKLWMNHHPMNGEMEYQYRSWEEKAQRKVYGKDPVFIFDPTDKRNRLPNDPDYVTPEKRWRRCPPSLQGLFTKAFTVALKDPNHRVPESEWQSVFLQLKDGAIGCSICNAGNLWESSLHSLNCWHCGKPVSIPPRLVFTHANGKYFVLLTKDARILKRHVDPLAEEGGTVLGQVVQNPANPKIWGIKNMTELPWTAMLPDGTSKEYPARIGVPLNPRMKLNIGGASAEIVA